MSALSSATTYQKHYIPLESNPEVFTHLIHKLGVHGLEFYDIYSLDDLSLIPRPALALILIFPTTDVFEKQLAAEEAARHEYAGSGDGEDVVWFRQTINNACGLYGILHAVCNGRARQFILPDSPLAKLLAICTPLPPHERAFVLENSKDLEDAHAEAARQGDSAVPSNAGDEVDFHYVCFVPSHKSGQLYDMDGDKKGPVCSGYALGKDEDMLGEGGLKLVRQYICREQGQNLGFGLLALVPARL